MRSLAEEASNGEHRSQDIGQEGCFGAVGTAEPGRAFDTTPRLVGIATFGVAAASSAQVPGRGLDFEITCQTDIAIWQGQANPDQIPPV